MGLKEALDDDNKENEEAEDTTAWANHDRDYTYDELLQRVYDIIKDKNPDSVMGEKKKFVMRPPQVVKVGTKKIRLCQLYGNRQNVALTTQALVGLLVRRVGNHW